MKYALCLMLLIVTNTLFAQFTINGTVQNDQGNPLSFASVTLYDKADKVITFKNTNSKGQFSITLSQAGTYLIKIRNIKFAEYQQEITITESQKQYNFAATLANKSNALDDVIVKGKASDAKISGDTITFKVDKFTDKTEKTLGDIINKLPGMEVDEQGNIKANGEKVDKLLVEGKEFFSESHKMATENLSSDAVKDIQLLTDYKENGKIDAMDSDKKTAVNINLKDNYKGKITGDISAGTGYEEKYDFHTNLFKFNKAGNISFIADVQNTGKQVLTFDDYLSFLGGMSDMMSIGKRGNSFNMNINSAVGSLLFDNNKVENRKNQMAAININQTFGKNTIKFTHLLSNVSQNSYTQSVRTYFETDANGNPIIETNRNQTYGKTFFSSSNFKYQYQPNDSTLLKYNAIVNFSNDKSENTINNTIAATQNFTNFSQEKPWNISQNIEYEFKLNKRLLLGANAFFEYSKSPEISEIYSDTPYLDLIFSNTNAYNSLYDTENLKKELGGNLSATYSKWKKIFKLETGYKKSDYSIDTDLYELIGANQQNLNGTEYQNRLRYLRNDVFADVSVSKNKGLWQYELGTIFKYYDINLSDQNEDFNRFALYPYAEISLNFSTTNVLSFNYKYSDNFPDLNHYLENRKLNNYRSVSLQNMFPNLYFPNQNLRLSYRYFNQFSGWTIWSSISYTSQDDYISSNSTLVNNYTIIQRLVAPYRKTFNGNFHFSKKFLKTPITLSLRGNFSENNGFSYINLFALKNQNKNYSISPMIRTHFKPAFNFELGTNFSVSENTIETRATQTLKTYKPYVELSGAYEKSGFSWNTSLSLLTYDGSNVDNFWNWEAELTYAPKNSKWEYSIDAVNLLNFNTKEQADVNFGTYYFEETQYKILPGFFMFGVKYRF